MSEMAVVCGLETEYGLMTRGNQLDQVSAALALLERCPLTPRVNWYTGDETPSRDARESENIALGQWCPTASDHPGFMLSNGARLYVDHGHPEYCTPECIDAEELIASDKAGDRLLERCRLELNRFLPLGEEVRLFKNNSDHFGNSYGCHENYLLPARDYEHIFHPEARWVLAHLVPFLVSRPILCGAGKVGSENNHRPVGFQISQRADFFETVMSLETMSHRPLINTRDEAHADRDRFRRLHLICGDANMAELSGYLKVGTTQMMLTMLRAGVLLPDLTLEEPLEAARIISRDPTCKARVTLADGRRLTAVELQLSLAEAADQFLGGCCQPGWSRKVRRWMDTLERLRRDPTELSHSLDWVIKWTFLDEWRRRRNLPWSAPVLEELDIRYHDIDEENGIFSLLKTNGRVESLIDNDQVERAIQEPISATRARQRVAFLSGPNAPLAMSWRVGIRLDSSGKECIETFEDPVFEGRSE